MITCNRITRSNRKESHKIQLKTTRGSESGVKPIESKARRMKCAGARNLHARGGVTTVNDTWKRPPKHAHWSEPQLGCSCLKAIRMLRVEEIVHFDVQLPTGSKP